MSDAVVTAAYPKEIAAAIIVVKKQIKPLGNDENNPHAGYRYVSVDKFYERIGPMMAEAGLALLIDETETDVRVSETTDKNGNLRKTPWLFAQYSLAFMHETGGVSAPMRRSLAMPITGPQTYGAAQSYVEKQFLRQIFKIPTGEKDADETAQDQEAPATTRPRNYGNGTTRAVAAPPPPEKPEHLASNGKTLPPHPEESAEATAARQRVRMLIDRLAERIKTAPDEHRLEATMDEARGGDMKEIEGSGPKGIEAANALRARYNVRISELRGKVA